MSISRLLLTKTCLSSNPNHHLVLIFTRNFSQQQSNAVQTHSVVISNICTLVTQTYQQQQEHYLTRRSAMGNGFNTTPLSLQVDPSLLTQEQALTILASLADQSGSMVALSFFDWAILNQKFRYFIRLYITIASLLLSSGNLEKAHEVMRCMVVVFAEIGKFKDAVDMIIEMHSQGLSPNVHTLNCVLRVAVELGLIKLGENVFEEMLKRGVSPDSCTFKTMVCGHCREGSSVFEVERWLRAMMDKGFLLDNVTCTMVVDTFCKKGNIGKVFGVFEKMGEAGLPPNLINYTVLVDRLCKRGSIKQAFEVLEEMVSKGWKPNVYTHTALIDGLCKKGWTEKAFRLFLKLVRSNTYKPNVCTYTAMINGYCKENKLNRAEMLLMRMIEQGLVPNTNTYTTLIDGHCKDGNISRAHELMSQMVKEGCEPNISTYNSIVDGLFKKGRVDEAYELLRMGFDNGLKPDRFTYTIIITDYCKRAHTKCAMVLFYKMVKSGCLPDIHTYTTLISAFCRQGMLKDSERLFEEAVGHGLVPTKQTLTSMICGYCRDRNIDSALKVFQKMNDHGSVDAIAYGALISGLCKESKLKEAHVLYNTMVDKRFSPCEVTRLTLAYEYCKKDDSATAMDLLDRLDKKLWIRTVNTLVRKLCREGKVETAAIFFHKLLDKGGNVDRVVLAGFLAACYDNDKYSVASSLSERISKSLVS
ncbi:hypothetical protein GIB67_020536 [Kingdonia uniflora]|uniref:Pentatricopeptide repeat-containing protein n=1 Tax=Kingdonia uniflora TaxID=39325 RepID=A0A7J7NLG8_9MAGN|nr:hypothetical protein GIB67_020536 [Kingdonia uniflora]